MEGVVRVLHIDDSPDDALLIELALEAAQQELPTTLQYVRTKEEYLSALKRGAFDIILSDYRMPDFDGEEALKAAKINCPEIPFIMVTGELGEENVIETLQRGATDYVLKSRIFRLIPAMKRALTDARNEAKRAEAERALRESEQRLRAIFDNAALGICEVDIEDRYIAVNDRICQILGYRREEMLGKSVAEVTAPEDRSLSDRLNTQLRTRGTETFSYEKRYLKRDGTRLWVHVTVSAIRNPQGNFIRSIVTIEDISARRQAEEALHESEERLRMVLEAAAEAFSGPMEMTGKDILQLIIHDITERKQAEEALQAERAHWRSLFEAVADEVWVSDAEGKISLMNLKTVSPMGLEEFHGKTIDELAQQVEMLNSDGTVRRPEDAPLLRSLRGEIVRGEEILRHRRTGIVRHRQVSAAPTRGADGAVVGAIAIFRDVTREREVERENRVLVDEMERRVQDRVRLLEARNQELQSLAVRPERRAGSAG